LLNILSICRGRTAGVIKLTEILKLVRGQIHLGELVD